MLKSLASENWNIKLVAYIEFGKGKGKKTSAQGAKKIRPFLTQDTALDRIL